MRNNCLICNAKGKKGLCGKHTKEYLWDSSIQGFRLKKRLSGSRYTTKEFHKNEINLTKILESYYGSKNVVTSYHPIWAVTKKNVLYEFDIYIKDKNILVEYNGIQHYEYTPFFQRNKRTFIKQRARDRHKAKLAKKQGARLIIFRYDEPIFEDFVINKIEKA